MKYIHLIFLFIVTIALFGCATSGINLEVDNFTGEKTYSTDSTSIQYVSLGSMELTANRVESKNKIQPKYFFEVVYG